MTAHLNYAQDTGATARARQPAPVDAALLSALPGCLALVDASGRMGFVSKAFASTLGKPALAHDTLANDAPARFLTQFGTATRPVVAEALEAARAGQSTDICVPAGPGGLKTLLRLQPAGEGRVLCLRGPEPVALEDRMREVDHRMKNSLATISSLVRIQARAAQSEDTRDALQAAALRVLTVGQVHEQLHRSAVAGDGVVDLHRYLRPLACDLVSSLSGGEVHLLCELSPITVSSAQAVGMGLIMTELVMNSLRHAVGPGTPGGLLSVRLEAGEGSVELTVEDSGPGLPDGRGLSARGGIGGRIVELYTRSLGAELRVDTVRGDGTRFTLSVPHCAG